MASQEEGSRCSGVHQRPDRSILVARHGPGCRFAAPSPFDHFMQRPSPKQPGGPQFRGNRPQDVEQAGAGIQVVDEIALRRLGRGSGLQCCAAIALGKQPASNERIEPFGIARPGLIGRQPQERGVRLSRKAEIAVCFEVEEYGTAAAVAPVDILSKRPPHDLFKP